MESPSQIESTEAMKDWIRNIQKWMEQNSPRVERKLSEDSAFNESFMELDQDSFGWALLPSLH